MKKTGKLFLGFSIFLSSVLPSYAQLPVILASVTEAPSGTTCTAHIKTIDFTGITGLQFIISWDSTVLRFNGIKNMALDISWQENFGAEEVSGGVLRFLWFEETLRPVSLDDSTTLFAINFTVTGDPLSRSELAFREDILTRIEVYDRNFNPIEARFEAGKLTVSGTTSGNSQVGRPQAIRWQPASPNPFSVSATIPFELEKATTARIDIFDVQGKKIYEEERHYGPGKQEVVLSRHIFPAPGAYYCRMSSSDFSVTQKVIFL